MNINWGESGSFEWINCTLLVSVNASDDSQPRSCYSTNLPRPESDSGESGVGPVCPNSRRRDAGFHGVWSWEKRHKCWMELCQTGAIENKAGLYWAPPICLEPGTLSSLARGASVKGSVSGAAASAAEIRLPDTWHSLSSFLFLLTTQNACARLNASE